MTPHISSAFDGGNIISESLDDLQNIKLLIRKDNQSDFFQWFYFRLTGAKGQACHMVIKNAGQAAYIGGWEDYRVVASYDRQDWFRIDSTRYENGALIIDHVPEQDHIYFAYFAPYSMERHADFIAKSLQNSKVSLQVLGTSLQGQSMDCLRVGRGPKVIWVIARQHPGETMAQWWMEGFVSRLIGDDDPLATALLGAAQFHIIPNMNPDGSRLGHLRTNFAGANLNREWGVATLQRSPEVYHVMAAMDQSPPDMVLDVHGDEALPYNFIAGTQGIPEFSDKQARNLQDFLTAYKQASPDFQTEYGYPVNPRGSANLTLCSNYCAHHYDCLAMTLEMPFKDNANAPDPLYGWSPKRSSKLGAAAIDPISQILGQL